ncbi:MAG: hypothetical protein ACFCD0_21235, partial [Gemmataceae bacterium]
QISHTIKADTIQTAGDGYKSFSPYGRTLASASSDKTVKLWDVLTGQLKATLQGHTDLVDSVSYSPDGITLASCSWDKTVKVWEVSTGKLKSTLEGHTDWVHSVSYSPNGRTLVSASRDKTVKLWEVSTGQLKATLQGHTDVVTSVRYSPNGRTLASGSMNKTIKLWRFPRLEPENLEPIRLSTKELERLWLDLGNKDFAQRDKAFRKLAAGQETSLAFLKGKIRPIAVPKLDKSRVQRLIKLLDDDRFIIRAKAQAELAKYGELAILPLEITLKISKSLEMQRRVSKLLSELKEKSLTPDRVRVLESLELFETLGTPAALSILEEISRDALIPSIRRAAESSLARISKK